MTPIEMAALAVMALIAGAGAWLDWRFRRLPNWLALAAWVCGLGALMLIGGWEMAGSALLHSIVALLAGMVLFRFGLIGGGDAKFYAGMAAWFPLTRGFLLVGAFSLVGLVIAVFWLVRRKTRAAGDFGKVPYGVAIAFGSIALQLWLWVN